MLLRSLLIFNEIALSKQNPNSVAYFDAIFTTKSGYSTYFVTDIRVVMFIMALK